MMFQFWRDTPDSNAVHSRRPLNTSFRQQRLKAWQPNLSPEGVLPILIIISCIFAPIGVGLLVTVLKAQAIEISYEQCSKLATSTDFTTIPTQYVDYNFKKPLNLQPKWKLVMNKTTNVHSCHLQWEIPNDLKSPVYLFYKLTNYHQNHRKYVESFDVKQLKGKALSKNELVDKCDPFREHQGKIIYPCGIIANSLFNDTFSPTLTNLFNPKYNFQLSNKDTAWSHDKNRYKPTKYDINDIIPPPNWIKMFPQGYNETNLPNLKEWPEFQVWMRTAALPSFYKLVLKSSTSNNDNTLHKGNYSMEIGLNYPVSTFNGTKSILLTNSKFFGARNITLSIIFFITAGLSALFSTIFLLTIVIKPKSQKRNHVYINYSLHDNSKNFNPKNNSSSGDTQLDAANGPLRTIL